MNFESTDIVFIYKCPNTKITHISSNQSKLKFFLYVSTWWLYQTSRHNSQRRMLRDLRCQNSTAFGTINSALSPWKVRLLDIRRPRNSTAQYESYPMFAFSYVLSGFHRFRLYHVILGIYWLNERTTYLKISRSLKTARLGFKLCQSLWHLTGTSAAALPRCLSNFRAIRSL